jgi:hypothetical protein
MNKLLTSTALVAVLALGAGTAFANDTADVTIKGKVLQVCEIGGTVSGSGSGAVITGDSDTAIATLPDEDGVGNSFFSKSGFQLFVKFSAAECNVIPVLTFKPTNGSIKNSAPSCGTAFQNEVPYGLRFNLDAAGVVQGFNESVTSAATKTKVTDLDEAFVSQELKLTFTSASDGGPFCAGDYTETIELELGPKV